MEGRLALLGVKGARRGVVHADHQIFNSEPGGEFCEVGQAVVRLDLHNFLKAFPIGPLLKP